MKERGGKRGLHEYRPVMMTTQVRNILESFDSLSAFEKRELTEEILRRNPMLDSPPLNDEQLIDAAEETFLELDRRTP